MLTERPGRKRESSAFQVGKHARRAHHQRALLQRADGLQRLAKAHVVGQHAAQPGLLEEVKPVDAVALVRPQRRLEPIGDRRGAQRLEAHGEGAQALEARGWRGVQGITELGQRRQRVVGHGAAFGPRLEEPLNRGAVHVEPGRGQGRPATALDGHEPQALTPRAQHCLPTHRHALRSALDIEVE